MRTSRSMWAFDPDKHENFQGKRQKNIYEHTIDATHIELEHCTLVPADILQEIRSVVEIEVTDAKIRDDLLLEELMEEKKTVPEMKAVLKAANLPTTVRTHTYIISVHKCMYTCAYFLHVLREVTYMPSKIGTKARAPRSHSGEQSESARWGRQ